MKKIKYHEVTGSSIENVHSFDKSIGREFVIAVETILRLDSRKILPQTVEKMEARLWAIGNCASKKEKCIRMTAYWTPLGNFCLKHREEAQAAMKAAKDKRYRGN